MSSVTKASLFGSPWGGLQFGDGLFGGHCLGACGPGLEAGHHGFEQGAELAGIAVGGQGEGFDVIELDVRLPFAAAVFEPIVGGR